MISNSPAVEVRCSVENSEKFAMFLKLLIVIGSTICIVQSNEENYCDPTLCDDGIAHTACDHYLVRKSNKIDEKSSGE
jgi:hypothetical protein